MRLWPDTQIGRTLALLIGMTLLLIIGSAILLQDERINRFDERDRYYLTQKVATLTKLINDANRQERQRIIEKMNEDGLHIRLDAQAIIPFRKPNPLERSLRHQLRQALDGSGVTEVRAAIKLNPNAKLPQPNDRRMPPPPPEKFTNDLEGVYFSIHLWDGTWLNLQTSDLKGPPPWTGKTLQLLALWLFLITISGFILARRMNKPLAQLAVAADQFGLSHAQPPLEETGTREVRRTIQAFNQMQQRLHKQIQDRSNMLAAISHDLRTPITTLRLRAEFIDDPEIRQKTLDTLEEMEAILSASLAFARDEAADEQPRTIDLAALLQSVVDDHVDLGGHADYQGPEKKTFNCRPVSLRRALNNLIDNASKYAGEVQVSLIENKDDVSILIEDNGPGIPEDKLEEVLTPFYRLESSRNPQTGGTGLGLAVANSIIIAHGGTLKLQNRQDQKGLCARVTLPSGQ